MRTGFIQRTQASDDDIRVDAVWGEEAKGGAVIMGSSLGEIDCVRLTSDEADRLALILVAVAQHARESASSC